MTAAILLAAGQSRRMGRPKVLLPWAGQTVIAHLADVLLAAAVDRLLVVVGPDPGAVARALAPRPVVLAINPDPAADMLSSVRVGLRALPPEARHVLVVPGDQPALTAAIVRALLRAAEDHPDAIIVPVCAGRRGHPIAFPASDADAVLTRFDGEGLRGLLAACPGRVREVPVDDPAVLQNLNRPEDYRAARPPPSEPTAD